MCLRNHLEKLLLPKKFYGFVYRFKKFIILGIVWYVAFNNAHVIKCCDSKIFLNIGFIKRRLNVICQVTNL